VPLPDPKPETIRDRILAIQDALSSRPDAPHVEVPPRKTIDGEGANTP